VPPVTPAAILAVIKNAEKRKTLANERASKLWTKFGAAVRKARHEKGIMLGDFARGLGVSQGMVTYLENGSRMWSGPRALRAIEILADWKPKPRHPMFPDCPVSAPTRR
jgi:DNA-binding transcriptional regulator YiaG